VRVLFKFLRSSFNITILLSALVVTPLLALSHFNSGLAGMLGNLADNYLPNPTLLQAEKKSRLAEKNRLQQERTAKRTRVARANKQVSNKGRRVLVRGAGALAVGWIPVIGVAADVISLEEDYRDICALFATIDELSALLYLPESNLYRDNYCDVPAQGIELLKESARDTRFPWEQQPWEVQP
jgi:hypothetical protein